MEKLQAERLCRVLVEKCVGIRPGEVSLIVTSPAQSAQVSKELFRSLTARGSRAMMLVVPEVLLTEDRLPEAVSMSMKQADVTVVYTQQMFPVSARKAALQSESRIVSITGMTSDMLVRAAMVDYDQLQSDVSKAAQLIGNHPEITLRAKAGTELTFAVDVELIKQFTGVARQAGDFTELPGGGINFVLKDRSASGRIVVDGSISGIGKVSSPVTFKVENGEITDVDGGSEAKTITKMLDKGDESARIISEAGAGFNPQLEITGQSLEDQRSLGSGQIGIGRNSHLGGRVHSNVHIDLVCTDCEFASGSKLLFPNR